MRKLWLMLGLLVCGIPAHAQAFNAAANNETTGTNTSSVTITIAAGELAYFCGSEGTNNSSTAAITDSTGGSNTWTQTSQPVSFGSTDRGTCFYSNVASQFTTATITWTGCASNNCTRVSAMVFDLTSIASSSPQDATVNGTASSTTTPTTGSLTTTNAADILVAYFRATANQTSCTAGSGYTVPTNGNANRICMEYKIVAATQSGVTTTITGQSASWETIFTAFKAAGGGAACTPTLPVMGVGRCG